MPPFSSSDFVYDYTCTNFVIYFIFKLIASKPSLTDDALQYVPIILNLLKLIDFLLTELDL